MGVTEPLRVTSNEENPQAHIVSTRHCSNQQKPLDDNPDRIEEQPGDLNVLIQIPNS